MKPEIIAPAPWALTGNGLVMIYHFPAAFIRQYGFLEPYQQQAYQGWIGAVMCIDYQHSNVGPYQELLFIPGIFRLGGRYTFSISKIWVSTYDSLWNGRKNWGIPKELAQFNLEQQANSSRIYKVGTEDRIFFEASVNSRGSQLPFTSRLVPWTRICQQSPSGLLLTKPQAKGKMQLSSLAEVHTDQDLFPPLARLKPLAVMTVRNFSMHFPVAWRLS
jgi:hypothetical protein